ncbi:endo alpha-1,4 polygalactosaminidase [Streptomyces sp. NPDC014734]|uniref:endo alpha-1,4 polygalactosaminidase n=1 Tax=Streptomyces sp. NPDC014734 TaxID=3364886 RepID=UPI0037006A01
MRIRPSLRRSSAVLAVSVAVSLLVTACSSGGAAHEAPSPHAKSTAEPPSGSPAKAPSGSAGVVLPPVHAGFDYQLGEPYTPPAGVSVVARDHTQPPAPGIYNICYINAFQAQPGAEKEWDTDLLLRDEAGGVVMDEEWGEAMLDVRTAAKRERIARKVNTWTDTCATKGYKAIDPDNYDSYARAPRGLLTADDAKAFLSLLADHAHAKGLAVGQKNTAELAPARRDVGADFAVVEECGQYDECGDYTDAFGDHVVVIEYTEQGMERACEGWGDRISVVRRDLDLVARGQDGYHRETCGGTA